MKLITTTSVIALTLSMAPSIFAQDGYVDVVITTAQKRAQNVQDVPIAITAVQGERLDELVIGDLSGISNITPNVNLDSSTPFGASQAVLSSYIRGIGADDFAFNIDPSVGTYVDGVYLARSVGANQTLLDVERIEVLKGPQGTIFGRNTIGGAISVVTRDPGEEFAAKATATYGNDDLFELQAVIEGGLAPGLTGSISASTRTRDGYVERVPYDLTGFNAPTANEAFPYAIYDAPEEEGGEDTQSLRGKLKWDNGENFTIRLSADYMQDASSQSSTLLQTFAGVPTATATGGPLSDIDAADAINANTINPVAVPGIADNLGPLLGQGGSGGVLYGGLYNICATQANYAPQFCNTRGIPGSSATQPQFGGLYLTNSIFGMSPYDNRFISNDIDKTYATGPNASDLESWGLNATMGYELNRQLTIKSITGYRDQSWSAGMDLDGSPLNILTVSFAQNQNQFSQEFQLIGEGLADGRLNGVIGAYYFEEEGDLNDFVNFNEGLLYVDGFNTFETENIALFGQAEFAVNDFITLLVGGRYTEEDKRFEGGQRDLNGGNYRNFGCVAPADLNDPVGTLVPGAAFPVPAFVPGIGGIACGDLLASLNNPGDNFVIPPTGPGGFPDYYESGQDTFRVFEPGQQKQKFSNFSPKLGVQLFPKEDLQIYGTYSEGYRTGGWTTRLQNPITAAETEFSEENATTYELGVKSRLFDNRVQLNAAAFFTAYDDIQLTFQRGLSPTTGNAGDAEIKGFEADLIADVTDQFSLIASVGYLDTEFTRIDPAVSVNPDNNPIPFLQEGIIEGGELPKAPSWQLNIAPRYRINLGSGELSLQGNISLTSKLWNNTDRVLLTERESLTLFDAIATYTPENLPFDITAGVKNITDERYFVTGNKNTAAGSVSGTYNRGQEWFVRTSVEF